MGRRDWRRLTPRWGLRAGSKADPGLIFVLPMKVLPTFGLRPIEQLKPVCQLDALNDKSGIRFTEYHPDALDLACIDDRELEHIQ